MEIRSLAQLQAMSNEQLSMLGMRRSLPDKKPSRAEVVWKTRRAVKISTGRDWEEGFLTKYTI